MIMGGTICPLNHLRKRETQENQNTTSFSDLLGKRIWNVLHNLHVFLKDANDLQKSSHRSDDSIFYSNIHHFCFTDLVTPISDISSIRGSKTSTNPKKDSLSLRLPYGSSNASSPRLRRSFGDVHCSHPRSFDWVHFGSQSKNREKRQLEPCHMSLMLIFHRSISPWKPIKSTQSSRSQTSDQWWASKIPWQKWRSRTSRRFQGWELLTSRYSV